MHTITAYNAISSTLITIYQLLLIIIRDKFVSSSLKTYLLKEVQVHLLDSNMLRL